MSDLACSNEDIIGALDGLGPVTTGELAGMVDCSDGALEDSLDALVDAGVVETRVVDGCSRLWWRIPDDKEGVDTFRAELAERLRPLTDPEEIQSVAGKLLAERLDVDRALYLEVFPDEETLQVRDGYARDGLTEVETKHRFSDFGDHVGDRLRRGEPLVVDDVTAIEDQSDEQEAAYLAADIHAYLTVPLLKSGRLVGLFTLQQTTPREWSDTAVELTRETVESTWAAVERARAERELAETNSILRRLTDASQVFIDADVATLRERVVELAREVVDCPSTTLWRYDKDEGELRAVDSETDPEHATPDRPSDQRSERAWAAFVSGEPAVESELDAPAGVPEDPSAEPIRSRLVVPLGRHGVLEVASTEPGRFDSGTLDLVETLAATIETAWDRASGEAALQRRNRELQELDELNTLIRRIDQSLVEADTVSAIDKTVCERLAESERYLFAWVGGYDPEPPAVSPRAWAGVDSSAIEALTATTDPTADDRLGPGTPATDPFVTAVQSSEMQTVGDIATDVRATPWREAALERGARSCHCIPLVYEESAFGVLVVYAATPHRGDRDEQVLAELGGTIAHAIHAAEAAATRQGGSVVELTLRVTDAKTPLCRLSRETGCVIESDGVVVGDGAEPTVVFTASGVTREALMTAAESSLSVDSLRALAAGEGGTLCKAEIADDSLVTRLQSDSATVQSLTIDAGVATAVVTLPETAAVREYLDGLTATGLELELIARRTRERSPDTTQRLQTAFREQLTPRQQEVFALAYRCGFFESPRVQTGAELADALGIAQSTFNYHLRGAQRQLCAAVFDPAGAAQTDHHWQE
ncbi:GAF domain-containing protein [Haloarcula salinisoli]|uniref:GAF domain-containing protein n=1 Tax=Haloarcula salinisoli TaxID=2487746 RepID=A0A8J7YFZ6_9EURY|nr:GAF domain-containing protein [Halomicroarcula salinisoli]MBX0302319.1 GAF domain-containing protein [Halomicroarcula salinisoli]